MKRYILLVDKYDKEDKLVSYLPVTVSRSYKKLYNRMNKMVKEIMSRYPDNMVSVSLKNDTHISIQIFDQFVIVVHIDLI